VSGHLNVARSVRIGDKATLVLGGRSHLYEGHSPATVVHGVRTAIAAGCRVIVLTNAAGGMDTSWSPGQPVVISDQHNLTGTSPMGGDAPPPDKPGRFCDMSNAYSPRIRAIAQEVEPGLPEGVYAGMFGGAYETPAEIRMLKVWGADLVGMSTVLATIAARHLGAEVFGVTLVTNMSAGLLDEVLDHADDLYAAAAAEPRMIGLLRGVIARL
jgi:purine-nucleoside phosphorylase